MNDELEQSEPGKKNWLPLVILGMAVVVMALGVMVYLKAKAAPKVSTNPDEQAVAEAGMKVRESAGKAMDGVNSGKFGTGNKFDQNGNLIGSEVSDTPENMTVDGLKSARNGVQAAGTAAGDAIGSNIDTSMDGRSSRSYETSSANYSGNGGGAKGGGLVRQVRDELVGGGSQERTPMLGYSLDDSDGKGSPQGVGRAIGATFRSASTPLPTMTDADLEAKVMDRVQRLTGASATAGQGTVQAKSLPALTGPVRSLPGEVFQMLGAGQGPRYKVLEGRFLDCVVTHQVEGANNESPVVVMVTRDFISPDGKWVLFPAGSTLIGVQGAVQVQQQTRLFIKMHKIQFPNETSLFFPERLLPQALNPDGSIGVVGRVNRHFWLQFGAAVCLGVVDGLAAANSQSVTQSQTTGMVTMSGRQYATSKVGDRLSQVTEKIMDKYANIVPTITLKSGDRMKVYFSEDVLVNGYMTSGQLTWVGRGR